MSTQTDEPTRQSRARGSAGAALGTAGEKLQENPMAAIAGGLGSRIGDAARDAYDAARATGQEKLDELGLTKDGARDKVKTLLDGALEAASAAGTAAKDALRGSEPQ